MTQQRAHSPNTSVLLVGYVARCCYGAFAGEAHLERAFQVTAGRRTERRGSYIISTGKAFKRSAPGNPGHRQKLSAGAIISNAGSRRSLRPADDARRRCSARVRCYHLSSPPSDTLRAPPSSPRDALRARDIVPGGYFVTTVIIFLPSSDSPTGRAAKISILSFTGQRTRAPQPREVMSFA